MPVCLIGLGSNQGDRQALLDAAVAELDRDAHVTVTARSAWRETDPIGGPSGQSRFLNGALRAETTLEPHALLVGLQQIENRLGRRRERRWGSRTIDLDLLLYDALVFDTPTLVLPHPRMAWRRFVIEPAAEVAGTMLHPTIRWTVARLLEHLNNTPAYVAVTGPIAAGKTQLAERLARAIPGRLIAERPDWAKLKTFYADPAGHAWQTELGFLDQRARSLAAEKGDSPRPTFGRCPPERAGGCYAQMGTVPFFHAHGRGRPCHSWTVSDFWFDQSAAFARAWLPEEQLPAFIEHYEKLRPEVIRPRLIVLLDASADDLLARVRRRGRACERYLTEGQLERIRQAMREQAGGPEVGPVLQVNDNDAEAVFTEVLAAVRAVE